MSIDMRPDLSCLCNFMATVEFYAYYSLLMHDVCNYNLMQKFKFIHAYHMTFLLYSIQF